MRKILLIPAAFICFLLVSCQSDTKVAAASEDNTAAQKNLEADHIVSDAFGSGDISKIDDAVSKDCLQHTEHGDVKGIDSLKAMITWMHSNMTDMKMERKKEFADKDYVFSWMRFTGNSNGAGGMPKGPYDMSAIEVSRFENGKAVEHWEFMEMQAMMKWMAQMNPQGNGQMNMPDSAMMKKK
jgi:predicted ester cyclase